MKAVLPLPPGKYHLDIQFTDWARKAAYRTARDVSIPAANNDGVIRSGRFAIFIGEDADPPSRFNPVHFRRGAIHSHSNASPAMHPAQTCK